MTKKTSVLLTLYEEGLGYKLSDLIGTVIIDKQLSQCQ
jgi:hypothetical protein